MHYVPISQKPPGCRIEVQHQASVEFAVQVLKYLSVHHFTEAVRDLERLFFRWTSQGFQPQRLRHCKHLLCLSGNSLQKVIMWALML